MDQRSPDHEHVTSREALAWAAGFFDGEGSTAISVGYNVSLSVAQKQREPLDWFQQAIGHPAHIYGPFAYKDGRDGQYELRINGMDRVDAVLDLLWPWLGPAKREQAERTRTAWASRATTRKMRVRPGRKRNTAKEDAGCRAYYGRRRAEALEHYGKVCACCCGTLRLQITRMDGMKFPRNSNFYVWLIQNNHPPGFETLCCSCATSKRTWGECKRPHGDRKSYLLRVMQASPPDAAPRRLGPRIIFINGFEYPRCGSRYSDKRCSDVAEHDGRHHNAYFWWTSSEAEGGVPTPASQLF